MTKLSKQDYYAVVGLLKLAEEHVAAIGEIERATAKILNVPPEANSDDYYGHVSDAMYSGYSARELLRKLNIKFPSR